MWWLVFEVKGKRFVWIEEAGDLLHARFKASMAGQNEGFLEGHPLDAKMGRKVPKASVEKLLSNAAAKRLLAQLG